MFSDDEFKLGENDDGQSMAQLRKYEVNKMKYFYAVVTCNARKTANRIIDEYQGFELELTNLRLNLALVPDELVFEQKQREECAQMPENYSFMASKVSRALNHSTVKLSWDQTDPKKQARLLASFKQRQGGKKQPEIDASEYADLIAGSDEESEYGDEASVDSEANQARIDAMRQKLLGGLSEDTGRNKDLGSDGDELDVNFGIGFGEDIGEKLLG